MTMVDSDAPRETAVNDSTIPLMEVLDLSKHFGGLRAVSSVSFKVQRGEIVGLIGPNGAGKTTLFGVLSGFLPPTSGKIRFQGSSITGLRPRRLCHAGIARTFHDRGREPKSRSRIRRLY
jgi:branched-chain amino acid transport system ATP-binding protein